MSHVMVWRGPLPEDGLAGFWHHGILCQDGLNVIHYAGMDGVKTLSNARIMKTPLAAFRGSDEDNDPTRPVHVVAYPPALHPIQQKHQHQHQHKHKQQEHQPRFAPSEVEARAEARIGHAQYHLLADNCETFARWCVTGQHVSEQSTGAVVGVAAGLASLLIGGGPLGAVLTALVTHKMWDRRRNRSNSRTPPADDDDDHRAFLYSNTP